VIDWRACNNRLLTFFSVSVIVVVMIRRVWASQIVLGIVVPNSTRNFGTLFCDTFSLSTSKFSIQGVVYCREIGEYEHLQSSHSQHLSRAISIRTVHLIP
jgi:hypothetical protein